MPTREELRQTAIDLSDEELVDRLRCQGLTELAAEVTREELVARGVNVDKALSAEEPPFTKTLAGMVEKLWPMLAIPAGGVLGLSAVLLIVHLVSPGALSSGKGPVFVFILVLAACLSSIPCYYALRGFSPALPSSRLRLVAGLCNGLIFLPIGVVASGYASEYFDAPRPVVFALAVVLFPAVAGALVAVIGRRINAGLSGRAHR